MKNLVTGAKNMEKLGTSLVATVVIQMSCKLVCKFVLMILCQVCIWVTWGQKLGHTAQILKKLC
jgi:hypothetical protein